MLPHPLLPALHLSRIQFRITQPFPSTLDFQRLGSNPHAQLAVHVCRELQARSRGLEAGDGRFPERREGELGEALRDGFELEQARQQDVDVRFAAAGLVDAFDHRRGQDANGNVLGDCSFPLGTMAETDVVGESVAGAFGEVRCRWEGASFDAETGGWSAGTG